MLPPEREGFEPKLLRQLMTGFGFAIRCQHRACQPARRVPARNACSIPQGYAMTAPLKQEGLPKANDPSSNYIYFRHIHHLRQAKKKSKQAAKGGFTFLLRGRGERDRRDSKPGRIFGSPACSHRLWELRRPCRCSVFVLDRSGACVKPLSGVRTSNFPENRCDSDN